MRLSELITPADEEEDKSLMCHHQNPGSVLIGLADAQRAKDVKDLEVDMVYIDHGRAYILLPRQ